jgi:hypothetical protein
MKLRPSLHRDHAKLSRDLASTLPDCETRQHLLNMAELYDAVADISDRSTQEVSREADLVD